MRFYIDRGAGCEARGAVDKEEVKRFLKVRGARNIREAQKYGWSNQPKVVTFDMPAGGASLYRPDDGALGEWAWDNGLTIRVHWKEA